MKSKQVSVATTTLFNFFGENWFRLSEKQMLKKAKSIGGVVESETIKAIDTIKQFRAGLRKNRAIRRPRVNDDELIDLCQTAIDDGWSYQTFLTMLPCGISTFRNHASRNPKLKRLKDMIQKDDQGRQVVVMWPDNHLEVYKSRRKAATATGISVDVVTKVCNHTTHKNGAEGFRFKDYSEWNGKEF